MKKFTLLAFVLLALVGGAGMALSQSLTGTVTGQVMDEQGAVLPGVMVTLSGRQGSQSTITDERGTYRFVGLNPGVYSVSAELSGFTPRTERDINVGITKQVQVDFTLSVGALAETVEVLGQSATVDTTSTASDNTLSHNMLSSMPINLGNFNTATNIMNYSPGINSGSGFGADEDYGNALLIDGVDTRDPEGGSSWVFFNYNIVEEIQVGGVGAQAEYGGFTGAVVNTITKSGGNMFSGLFEARHTNDSLAGNNVSSDVKTANPSLGDPAVITKLWDYTVQFGGPLKANKAFYWFSVQRYAFDRDPSGPLSLATEVSPRYNGKLTFNLTPNDTLTGSFQFDNYNVTGRTGKPPANVVKDNQTVNQDSPEAVWNAQYRRLFGTKAFLEAKFTGYWGYYYLDPIDPTPSRLDIGTGEYFGGAGSYYYADRGRNQLNVSVTNYAQKFGTHNLKFGVEIERSKVRTQYGYSQDIYFLDYYAQPYYAYSYSYDIDGRNKRESVYAQDSWQVGRLTTSAGLRLDHITGYSPAAGKDVYNPELALGPRVGVVFDVAGTGRTVLKTFWGRYYEAANFAPFELAVPGRNDFVTYVVHPGDVLEEVDRTPGQVYGVDSTMKHMRVDEFTVGFEHQLRRDMRFAVTGIWRDWGNFVAGVVPDGRWSPVQVATGSGLTGAPLTLYRWANRSQTQNDRLMRNIDGFQYLDTNGNVIGTLHPSRNYKGVMTVLTKNFSNRWQAQASYVWSEATGSVGNTGLISWGSGYVGPNLGYVNADGAMENDRTHEFKLLGGYQLPLIELNVTTYYRAISGARYTPFIAVSGSTLNYPGTTNARIEPRGSRRLPVEQTLDLRFERRFDVNVHKIGVFVDIGNVFNNDVVLARQARYPNRSISGSTVAFDAPTSIQQPRQITFGARWTF
jgi:carboxypeptidase family protein